MKIKLTILLLLTSFLNFGQDLNEMKKDVLKMQTLTIAKKYAATLDYTHPKVFELASKEQLIEVMNNIFDNDLMTITMVDVAPNYTYSDIITASKGKYCVIEYNSEMNIEFKEDITETKEIMIESLQNNMKNYNITFDEKLNTINASGKAQIIAISDELTNGSWKFINYDEESPMMEKVLSKEILKQLGL
ncbi:MAG: hypothetical protein V4666_07980 [Bacteroidota bacterium]